MFYLYMAVLGVTVGSLQTSFVVRKKLVAFTVDFKQTSFPVRKKFLRLRLCKANI